MYAKKSTYIGRTHTRCVRAGNTEGNEEEMHPYGLPYEHSFGETKNMRLLAFFVYLTSCP